MRKLIVASLLGLAGVGLTASPASAGIFSCLFGRCNKCCDGQTTLCVRAYNAFSPTCFGSIACNGCFPIAPAGQVGGSHANGWGGGYCGPECDGGGIVDGACIGPDCGGYPIVGGHGGHPIVNGHGGYPMINGNGGHPIVGNAGPAMPHVLPPAATVNQPTAPAMPNAPVAAPAVGPRSQMWPAPAGQPGFYGYANPNYGYAYPMPWAPVGYYPGYGYGR